MKKCFMEEGIQIVDKHMKRYSTTLALREMQIKITTRYPTTVRMAKIKNVISNLIVVLNALIRMWGKSESESCSVMSNSL